MFMEILVDLSYADSSVTPAEQHTLVRIAQVLHIPAAVFEAMLGARRAGVGGGSRGYQRDANGRQRLSLQQAYATLGISDSASDVTELRLGKFRSFAYGVAQ